MSSCTCSKDAQMTCIVHPTELSLKRRIAELEAENAELRARELGFIQSLHELADTIAKREAENAKLRMNLDAYKQAEELWCRQDEKREVENAKLRTLLAEERKKNQRLREALETISRLEPYDGNRHVYHSAGKVARKALAL